MFIGIAPLLFALVLSRLGMVLLLLPAVAMIEHFVTRRDSQQRTNAALLALLAESRDGFSAAEVFATSQVRGFLGRQSLNLLERLANGDSLRLSMLANPQALPREAMAYAAVGDLSGDIPAAMSELAQARQSALVGLSRNLFDRAIYLLLVLAVFIPVLTFIMIKIIPEFRKIFDEFGLDLPIITEYLVGMAESVGIYLALPIAAASFLLMLLVLAVVASFFTDIPFVQYWLDRLTSSRHIATFYRLLAFPIERHAPLAPVLDSLWKTVPARFLRSRIAAVSGDVGAGTPLLTSMRRRGLLSDAEFRLAQAGEAAGNLGWILRILADRRDRQWVYRLTAISQIVFPLMILAIGLLIGLVVIGLFIPLVDLIDKLAF